MGYGGILLGVLRLFSSYVSWQALLGGAAGGVVAALLLRPRKADAVNDF
jgi:membrane associated rhomboid family serine protease